MDHKVIPDDNECILKTTHERVEYDEITEEFIVRLDDETHAAIYGRNHMQKAFEIAELLDSANDTHELRKNGE
jgi:hypothetical protein